MGHPNNPSGTLLSLEDLAAAADEAARWETVLAVDEASRFSAGAGGSQPATAVAGVSDDDPVSVHDQNFMLCRGCGWGMLRLRRVDSSVRRRQASWSVNGFAHWRGRGGTSGSGV